MEQQAEPIVGEVSKSMADTENFLDQQVDRLGGAIAGPPGGEVGQEFLAPCGDGARQPGDLSYPGVDAGNGPAIESGGGVVAVTTAVDRA